jgi:hypothetical protein
MEVILLISCHFHFLLAEILSEEVILKLNMISCLLHFIFADILSEEVILKWYKYFKVISCLLICIDLIPLSLSLAEILSEEVILKWYKDGHVAKGWTVYGEQMKKFIEWLEHAESGNKVTVTQDS